MTYSKITFKPVSGGFRCNQTGDFVSRRKTKEYKHRKLNEGKVGRNARVTIDLPENEDRFPCPNFGCPRNFNYSSMAGKKMTCSCGQRIKVKVIKKKEPAYQRQTLSLWDY